MNPEDILNWAVMMKFLRSEPMSKEDFNRFLNIIETCNLELSAVDAPTAGAMQVRFRSILQKRFLQPQ